MEHYFTNNPELKSEIRKIPFEYKGKSFSFFSDNGVFSKNKIDYASRMLLETFLEEKEQDENLKVLDVGCGYGFLGVSISRLLNCYVDLIDINKRAIHLAEMNINAEKVNARAFISNIYENVSDTYDYIITNPPIRAGKEVVLKILSDAKLHLINDGELWFVINKDQGAKSTKKALDECYNIECRAKSKGFYVYCCKKH